MENETADIILYFTSFKDIKSTLFMKGAAYNDKCA